MIARYLLLVNADIASPIVAYIIPKIKDNTISIKMYIICDLKNIFAKAPTTLPKYAGLIGKNMHTEISIISNGNANTTPPAKAFDIILEIAYLCFVSLIYI
jgi:hypothetical protein